MLTDDSQFATTQRNLRRLAGLRAVSIAVQALLVVIALRGLHLDLPVLPLALILLGYSLWNGFTLWRARQPRPVSDNEFLLQLVVDALALTGVLYFTGGATNPFAWFYLLPLMIAATLLPKRRVWFMAALTITCYSLLMAFHVPLVPAGGMAMGHMEHDNGFSQHVFGMWFGFVLSAGLVSYFVTNMANTLRARERVLAEAREQALRDERLVALGTLAAGAAHELGTPLGTMALVVDDLLLDHPAEREPELHAQLALLREQLDRSKQALSVISASAGEPRADGGDAEAADRYLQGLFEAWRVTRPGVDARLMLEGDGPAPRLLADHALDQALRNILNNAADASAQGVELHARWNARQLTIEVLDCGPGLDQAAASSAGKDLYSSKAQGLGVGLFLAHAVIERLGGRISHRDRPHGGTCTCITLPTLEAMA